MVKTEVQGDIETTPGREIAISSLLDEMNITTEVIRTTEEHGRDLVSTTSTTTTTIQGTVMTIILVFLPEVATISSQTEVIMEIEVLILRDRDFLSIEEITTGEAIRIPLVVVRITIQPQETPHSLFRSARP